jgi:uncharacterized protein
LLIEVYSMREQLLVLYELQKIDVKITKATSQLAALDGARETKKRLLAVKSALDEAEKSLKQQETELVDLELRLKSVDEKRAKFEKRLYGGAISNPKEITAAEKEIATLKEQQGNLDTQTLTLYDSVDAARAVTEESRKNLQAVEDELRAALGQEAAEKKRLDTDLADLNAAREAAASKVTDVTLMARYDTVRRKTGNTGAAKIVDGRCEACHVAVVPFVFRKLAEDTDLFNCESCGRILLLDVRSDE